MNPQKHSLLAFAAVFFFSCSGDNSPAEISSLGLKDFSVEREQLTEQEVKLLYKMRKPDNRIDVEEAMAIANEFKANIYL